MIQCGICGRMLLCTFVTEIVDSWRIGSIRRPNGLIFFSFPFKLSFLLGVEDVVVDRVGWAEIQFCAMIYVRHILSR